MTRGEGSSEPAAVATLSDAGRSLSAVLAFGLALNASTLVMPLLALHVGIPAPIVGLLTASSGASQLLSRLALPWLLERISDRRLILVACGLLAISAASLMVSVTVATFVLAQLLQGSARALFWTSSQTHALRSRGVAIRKLARVQTASHLGGLAGPAIAGTLLALSATAALAFIVGVAAIGAVVALFLTAHPPYPRKPRDQRRERLWRQPAIAAGCWTAVAAGGWRGIAESFVPVALATAGLGAALIGALVAVAELATVLMAGWLAVFGRERYRVMVPVAGASILTGAVLIALFPGYPLIVATALALGGLGGGLAGSTGPAIVNAHATPENQGTAIALSGTYRAAARLGTPAMLAMTAVVAFPVALAIAAVSATFPMLIVQRRVRWDASPETREGITR